MEGDILANRSAKDRNSTDFYPTPPDVTIALLDFLESKGHLYPESAIWEPACGTGAMADVMIQRGYEVWCSDINPRGYERAIPDQIDFLETYPCNLNWIITNPPFSKADEFILHALQFDRPFAFLLKSQFWHAKKRRELFLKQPPAYVLPLTWRPDFLGGEKSGKSTMECLWTVWLGSGRVTEYYPLERPERRKNNGDQTDYP